MTHEEEFQMEGLISDISKNSVLITTQLNKAEEIQAKIDTSKTLSLVPMILKHLLIQGGKFWANDLL
ncbi:MAG TPA: hypothetical protein EYP03_03825 [Aquificae bacterium]|nr:hypothetical protein [Aquificota bacterium]